MSAVLSSAQRLERCLRGQPTDRVPIWMLYNAIPQANPWYPNVLEIPSYAPVVQRVMADTDLFQRHWFGPGVFYADPACAPKTTRVWRDQGYRMFETHLQTPAGELVSYARRNANGEFEQKPLIVEIEDLGKILSIPYQPFRPDLSEFRRIRAELGERGLMMVNLCDPLSLLYFHADSAQLMLWMAAEAGRVGQFLDVINARLTDHLHYLLEEGVGPVYFIVGSEFACPPMVSPRIFRSQVVHYDKPLIETLHAYDCLAITHHHGAARRILDDLTEMQPNGIHPLEAPPVGDTPLGLAKATLGQQTSLIGTIQYDTLIQGSADQVQLEVRAALQAWKPGGRFILAPSAGPYQDTLSPQAVSNLLAMIQLGLDFGKYA